MASKCNQCGESVRKAQQGKHEYKHRYEAGLVVKFSGDVIPTGFHFVSYPNTEMRDKAIAETPEGLIAEVMGRC